MLYCYCSWHYCPREDLTEAETEGLGATETGLHDEGAGNDLDGTETPSPRPGSLHWQPSPYCRCYHDDEGDTEMKRTLRPALAPCWGWRRRWTGRGPSPGSPTRSPSSRGPSSAAWGTGSAAPAAWPGSPPAWPESAPSWGQQKPEMRQIYKHHHHKRSMLWLNHYRRKMCSEIQIVSLIQGVQTI